MSDTQARMAENCVAKLLAADPRYFTRTAPHSGTRYDLSRLQDFGARFLTNVLLGKEQGGSLAAIARRFQVSRKVVATFLQQADYQDETGAHRLNFFSAAVVGAQAQELARALYRTPGESGAEWVRTLPTSPRKGVHATYNQELAFGMLGVGTTCSIDATFATCPTSDGREESINVGGFVQATDHDRAICDADPTRTLYLSPQHKLSLRQPIAAMFAQAGATFSEVARELPEHAGKQRHLILGGRHVGPEASVWQQHSTRIGCVINEPGYGEAARSSHGDAPDIIMVAEGPGEDRGLERNHEYVPADGAPVPNARVRKLIRERGQYWALDDKEWTAESSGLLAVLLPGELRSTRPGCTRDRGQALLIVSAGGQMKWYSVLHTSDGSPAWTGHDRDIEQELQKVADAIALIEGEDSTAGPQRREQFASLDLFNVPLSQPTGRENIWRLAAAVRQSQLPEGLFRGPRIPA